MVEPYKKATVLIVEDNDDTRAIVGIIVRACGYEQIEARDGLEAKELIERDPPDMIVADIMMPRMSGTELIAWLRGENFSSYIPVLVLSALSDVGDRVAGLDAGADDYLIKPFQHSELQARIKSLLRIKGLMDKLEIKNRELAQLNEKLSLTQAELVKKERQLVASQLAGGAAHHLGQPLASIVLNCHILEKEAIAKERNQELLRVVAAIKAECKSIQEIVDKLEVVDANNTTSYIEGISVLEMDNVLPKKNQN